MLTLIANSTNQLTYIPNVFPADSISVTLADAGGAAIAVGGSPVAGTNAYTLTLASSEVPVSLVGQVCTATWVWTYGGSTLTDVEEFTVRSGDATAYSPHSMTFLEMQEQTYYLMDEDESALFPRAIIKRYINQGLYEVAVQASMPLVRQTFTAPFIDTNACILTDPLLARGSAVVSNVRVDGIGLESVNENDVYDKTSTGTPSGYWIDGGTVRLSPMPLSTFSGVVVIEYLKEPSVLTLDTDTSELPITAQELACVWAAAKAKGKDDEYNYRDRLMSDFADGIARMSGPLPGFYE